MTDKQRLLSQKQPGTEPDCPADEASLGYMLRLAAPMVVTTVSFTVMQFVDRFMVSRLGTDALAAILPAGFVAFIPGSFAMGVIAAVTIFASQSLGRGSKQDCSNYCWQAIYMGLAYSAVVIAVMWPAAPLIFRTMGYDAAVANMEVTYLRITLYAQFLAVFVWSCNQFFIGVHRPIIIMYAALCSQVVNLCANYVLIFGKFGFPAMGIAGAGWGTFIGIVVGAVIRMTVFLTGNTNAAFHSRRAVRINFSRMLDLLKVGLPAGFELMWNVTFWGVILFWLVGKFGKEASAATSAVFACTNVSIMPVVGINIALSAAVGKAIGAGRKKVAAKQTSLCLKIAITYMGLVGLCFFIFRNALMSFWSSDDRVIEIGVNILVCAAIYQVFHAARAVYSGSLRGAGDTWWLAIASALGAVVILGAGGVLTVIIFPGLGSLGPWIAATVSIIAVGLANRWRFKSNRWMRIDLFKARQITVPIEADAAVE